MQVVDTLEIFFLQREVKLDHCKQFLDGAFLLPTFHQDSKLPCALLDPELKRSAAGPCEELLSLLVSLLGEEELEIEFAEADGDRSV